MANVLNRVRKVRDVFELISYAPREEVEGLCSEIETELVRLPNHSPLKDMLKERLQLLQSNLALAA